MASVQELLLAAEAKKRPTPFIDLLNTGIEGYQTGQGIRSKNLDINTKLLQLEQLRQEKEAQAQMQQEIAKTLEEQTKQNFNSVGGPPKPVMPVQKFKTKINQDEKGRYSRTYEIDNEDKTAAENKVYTPEQVNAIKSGDAQQLSKVFPAGVPKDALSLAYSAERIASLQDERAQQREERLKNRYRNYVVDIEQRDPVIKAMNQQELGLNQVDNLMGLIKSGNTIAANALGAKMARGMGEVGVLTDIDVRRYVQSGKMSQGAADRLSKMMTGVPTDATLNEIQEITKVLKEGFENKVQPQYDKYIRHYSQIEGVAPEQFAADIGFRYSGKKADSSGGVQVDEDALDAELQKRGLLKK